MTYFFSVLAFEEGNGGWVSICLNLDLISQGDRLPSSLEAIAEAVKMVMDEDPQRVFLYNRAPEKYWEIRNEILRQGVKLSSFEGDPKRAYAQLKVQVGPTTILSFYEEILVDGVQVAQHVHSDSNERG